MIIEVISSLIIILFFLYTLILRPILLRKKKFKCLRCGKCCKLIVKLNKEDIEKLKRAGKKDFIHNGKYLKRYNGRCIFLKTKNNISTCTVERIKPRICRIWPLYKYTSDIRCCSYAKKLF